MDFLEDIDTTSPDFGDFYDELPLWSAPFGLMLLDRVSLTEGATIVDVGSGTGFLSVELAQRSRSATVVAVDPWKGALTRLRRKLAHLGLSNVQLVECDAAAIDLPDASVTLLVSNLGINNFENAPAVPGTCFRIAKPGARLLLTTNLVGHMAEFYDVYRMTLLDLGRPDRLPALDAHIAHRTTVAGVRSLLTEAGFTVAETVTDSFRMRFADGSSMLNHYFIRLGFMAGWKSIAPPDAMVATFEALERNLNTVAKARGDLTLTIPMALISAFKPVVVE